MKNTLEIITITSMLFALSTNSFAQTGVSGQKIGEEANTVTTAVPFLMIAPEARAGALGDAGVASTPDGASTHWNAAKLAFIEKDMGFSISYTPWLKSLVPDINLAYLTAFKRFGKYQTAAISMRYFSLGNIKFTDINAVEIGQFNPNEFALDASFARKLSDEFSVALAGRFIYSNLTGGITVENTIPSHAGLAVASDLSLFYTKPLTVSKHKTHLNAGLNISNIGNKIAYTETGNRDFIPTNLRVGSSWKIELDDYNTIEAMVDLNKLMVPTNPIYKKVNGQNVVDAAGNKVIESGYDPNVGVVEGMIQSFYDAPGGSAEEFREITYSAGIEYWYDKQFAVRGGYFHEDQTKGNRKYFTFGIGLKFKVFGIDFAYLVPTQSINPLANTLRFSLLFDFDSFANQKTEVTE